MNKEYVFFSNIGTTDPTRGQYDGPFLHIIRHYKPKKVYIFLTKEMREHDKLDNRYEIMAKKVYKDIEVIKLIHDKIDKPHLFNELDDVYEETMKKIVKENPGAEILVNVSSGTFAMQCSIYNLAAHSKDRLKIIQVISPENKSNDSNREGKEYDCDLQFECLEDNNEDAENRCREVYPRNIRKKTLEDTIEKQISIYDYEGAYKTCKEAEGLISEEVITIIKNMNDRSKLHLNKVDKKYFPIESSDVKSMFEYILVLQIKQRRKELMEFTRAISPIITDLYEACLKNVFKVDIHKYCTDRYNSKTKISVAYLDREKLEPDVLAYYDECFVEGYKTTALCANNMLPYIEYLSKNNNKNIFKYASSLRKFEEEFRNIAAHEIMSVTDEQIKRKIGIDSTILLEYIKKLFEIAEGKQFKKNINWDSYDKVNEEILQKLKENI